MLLFLISFVAGVLTVLAPCVLPLLPVIVGGSVAGGGGWRRVYTICISLGISVIVFTLLLKATTVFISIPEAFWEWFSGLILVGFGLTFIFPALWDNLGFVNLMNRSSNKALAAGYQKNSFLGDVLMGAALGPVFSSCSPTYFIILATVLPASFAAGIADLLAYAVGLSGFLFIIAIAGQRLVDRLGVAIEPRGWFRRTIGVIFIAVGLGVLTGQEARLERVLFDKGFDATRLEQTLLGAHTTSGGAASDGVFLDPSVKARMYKVAPELVTPDGYINTDGQPITIGQFKGKKVVLLDIWTYSCINCQRTIPYVNSWYDKYKDEGLEIIGLHTPEFAFEHVYDNVAQAVKGFGIKYPVVLDNEYQTWNAYGNQFWPRKYLIDIDGYVVYDHIGEGGYDETEAAIVRALQERAQRLGQPMPQEKTAGTPQEVEVQAASPETYFGAARNEYLGNGRSGVVGEQTFTLSGHTSRNTLYLGGTWNLLDEYAQSASSAASISYTYAAKSVYFVAASKNPVRVKVLLDGAVIPSAMRGTDVDADGYVTIQTDRLYKLVESDSFAEHTLKLQVEGAGLEAYTFTFG